jgi:streptogrisin C
MTQEANMDRSKLIRLAAPALAAVIAATLALAPAPATATATATATQPGSTGAGVAGARAPGQLAALARDLDLSTGAALARLADDRDAARTAAALAEQLGGAYAGAWVDGGEPVIALTDPDQVAAVRAAGAHPRLVARSAAALAQEAAALDRAPAPDPADVYSWGIDVRTNQVVVRAARESVARAGAWVARSDADRSAVRIEASTGRPLPAWDIIGGNRYTTSTGSCSIGFSVRRGPGDWGYVTAGHCGTVGVTTSAFNGSKTLQLGTFQNSNFPGVDMAYVQARIYAGCTRLRLGYESCWLPQPWVNQYAAGGNLVVTGKQVAPVGAAVCRSGATSGWHCGTITATNQTANYAQGPVHGLTFTTACVEPGDSGGAYVALGSHAQGVTSGGTVPTSCGTPDRTSFFQPLDPILSSYGLTLVTG